MKQLISTLTDSEKEGKFELNQFLLRKLHEYCMQPVKSHIQFEAGPLYGSTFLRQITFRPFIMQDRQSFTSNQS